MLATKRITRRRVTAFPAATDGSTPSIRSTYSWCGALSAAPTAYDAAVARAALLTHLKNAPHLIEVSWLVDVGTSPELQECSAVLGGSG